MGVGFVVGVDGDADAGRHEQLVALDGEGLGGGIKDFFRHDLGMDGVFQLGQDDHELVAAESRHRIAFAQAFEQPSRGLAQQLVADGVAEAVVDLLELVEVDDHQGHHVLRPVAADQRLGQAVQRQ